MTEKKPGKKRAMRIVKGPARKPTTRRGRKPAAVGPRALVEATADTCFWVNCGPVLKDLRELRDALQHSISEAQFAHHVGARKNDFANWVEAVLDDIACAKALRRAKTRVGALRAVERGLAAYV